MNPSRPRPVLIVGAIVTAVNALIALGVAFGFTLTPEQLGAVVAVTGTLSTVVGAFFVQTQVTPVSNPQTNEGVPLVPEV